MTRPASRPLTGIAFDMDGVLVDTERCHESAFEKLWQTLEIDGPAYRSIAGRPTGAVVAEVTEPLDPAPAQVDDWVALKQRLARECIKAEDVLFADAARAIGRLGARFALALVTGGSRTTVEATLERYELSDAFELVLTGDDVDAGKPDPEGYARAATAIVTDPSHLLVIEDSGNGIDAGLAAGACVVSVRTGETRGHERFLGQFETLDQMVDEMALLG